MKETDLLVIQLLAAMVPPKGRIVEVGSFMGRSAVGWAMSAPQAEVHCIDYWREDGDGFDNVWIDNPHLDGDLQFYTGKVEGSFLLNTKGIRNIFPHKGSSVGEYGLSSVDLVFIDGDHSYEAVLRDMVFWAQRLNENGLLCGHDFDHNFANSVVRAVALFAEKAKMHLFCPRGTYLWMLFKDINHMRYWLSQFETGSLNSQQNETTQV